MRFHEAVHGVYFDDLDAFRILHNARYLLLFERTIGDFWQHLGWGNILDAQLNPDQYHLVRANHIEYLSPVTGPGRVRCRIGVDRLGKSSLTFGFQILPMDEDLPHAVGTRTLVRVDPHTRAATPWTDGFRARLRPYLRDVEPGAVGVAPEAAPARALAVG
jgi:acyl-CoA thioester hydrolase